MNAAFNRLATLLSPEYRVLRLLGAGGAAYVFAAEDVVRGRRVAIKVLCDELADSVTAERFLAEINTTAKLRHHNIVPLLDSGAVDGLPYYVMPLVDGDSLRARMTRVGAMTLGRTVQVVAQIGAALDYAHQRRVIHRDIKPENVILGAGRVVVLDFGIALALDAIGYPRRTMPNRIPGTVEYMSPEQAGGEPDIDGRSDQYSLACVAYELISGTPPFTGPLSCVLLRHISVQPEPLARRCRHVPEDFSAAIDRALAKAPCDRYPTTGDFVADLRASVSAVPCDAMDETIQFGPSSNQFPFSMQ